MTRLRKLMTELRAAFGDRCDLCGARDALEFAHIEPNGCVGKGRGGLVRAYSIKNNPAHYRLLCHTCHQRYDRFVARAQALHTRVTGRWYLGTRIRRR
jgi:hypothetical protein